MRIVDSSLALSSQTRVTEATTVVASGRVWADERLGSDSVAISVGAQRIARATNSLGVSLPAQPNESSSLPSEEPTVTSPGMREGEGTAEIGDEELLGTEEGAKLVILRKLVEHLTGRQVSIARAEEFKRPNSAEPDVVQLDETRDSQRSVNQEPLGWGAELSVERATTRTESLAFAAKGSLLTSDGRMVRFEFALSMDRQELSVERMVMRLGDAEMKDPLVLVTDTSATELGEQIRRIDLDRDGKLDNLRLPANGFYLALDRNGSGKIDDPSELFGATSGDGFSELSVLDQDKNGFIDEADSGFYQLRLWVGEADGGDRLVGLAEAGVGALATARLSTPFELRSGGELTGRVRSTGVYFTESGETLPMQQIDVKA